MWKTAILFWTFLLKIYMAEGRESRDPFLTRLSFDGILYESPDPFSKSVHYSKTTGTQSAWRNLSTLIETYEIPKKSLFCSFGQGSWLVYPGVNFKTGNVMSLKLTVGEACVHAENAASIQPLGPINKQLGHSSNSGLVTFTSSYYTSEHNPIAADVLKLSGSIKSLFHAGPNNWTIEGYNFNEIGQLEVIPINRYCLYGAPYLKEKVRVCGVPDIEYWIGNYETVDKIVITKGCQQSVSKVIKETCYNEGSYTILAERDIRSAPSPCKGHFGKIQKRVLIEFSYILEVWKIRMNKMHVEKNPENPALNKQHLHDFLENSTEQMSHTLEAFLLKYCGSLSYDYIRVLKHLSISIFHHTFNWMGKQEGKRRTSFVHSVISFQQLLSNCNQTSIRTFNISECIRNPQESVIFPFDQILPGVLEQIGIFCKHSELRKSPLIPEILSYLSHSYVDWNTIYDFGLNGVSTLEQQNALFSCFRKL